MAGTMLRFAVLAVLLVCLMGALLPAVHAQGPAAPPSTNGSTIDQGIAYVMLFMALVLTYIIHPLDAIPYNIF
ncbi:unnamed protein product [Sphagnum troendelagicum]|jgi:hypothetical protein|uniref:Uncharacterized protein n=3 Tax=Sphagnum TaxID=13804 RepID=A0ACB8HPX7_9BRYO|nr:hypothetical protein BDL97_07G094200 [Sphagnum fallax]KAH9557790.1 hypothetical protein CY35_07G103000 [Sphagnum magellanicum]